MFELLDEWKFLAGLGIFLFGIFMMEESIKLLAGRSFKTLIRRYTGTRIKGLITGIVSTSILQSSSAVSLMVLAFVGAGLMTLVNAIAVIMGAKVGTTITAWIVAIFGFKFKIEAFALPMIGLGGLGLIFLAKSPRYVNISKLLAAFGFLFHGLDFMKSSVEELAVAIDLSALPDLGLWVYVAAGILLTAIMQSSSATIAVILTTLFTGIIDFRAGAAMVIGANVGTTVTILLGAIGGIPAKKQAAISSLVYNIGTATVVLMILPVMFWLILDIFEFSDNVVLGVALFHTMFNVTGVLVFFPLIPILARYLERIFPEKRTVLAQHIVNTTPEVPEAAIAALRKEVLNQLYLSIAYIASKYRIVPAKTHGDRGSHGNTLRNEKDITYEDLGRLHAEIFAFYAQVQAYELDEQEAIHIEPLMRSSRSIMNATKNLYEILSEIEDIGNDDKPFMMEACQNFKGRLKDLKTIVEKVAAQPDDENMTDLLKQFFIFVEEADKNFIRSCSRSVTRGIIREKEVTRLLMVNRLFTQSSRMLVLSMQGLTQNSNRSGEILQNDISPIVKI
jgi:phosphate:Na+ symporter